MRITNVDPGNTKILVEVEDGDIRNMESRISDYVRGVVTEQVIQSIKKEILADEEYMKSIKEAVKKRLDELKITNVEFF